MLMNTKASALIRGAPSAFFKRRFTSLCNEKTWARTSVLTSAP